MARVVSCEEWRFAVNALEVIRYAYRKASEGQIIIPKFRSSTTKVIGTNFLKMLGVHQQTLFAPYDIEVDPRFELVAEYRHQPLLRKVRMQDAVLESIYAWMIERHYGFYWSSGHSSKAYFAKFIRQFGFVASKLPAYMPLESIKTTIQFEALATAVEDNLASKESAFYKTHGYLPSFQDMLRINEDYRHEDCQASKQKIPIPLLKGYQQFHRYFHPEVGSCD